MVEKKAQKTLTKSDSYPQTTTTLTRKGEVGLLRHVR